MFKKLFVVACAVAAMGLNVTASHAAEPVGYWTDSAPVVRERNNEFAVRLDDGRVLAGGGIATNSEGYGVAEASVEAYDPRTKQWAAVAPMHVAKLIPLAATLGDGRVLVLGEGGEYIAGSDTYELFNPTTNTWSQPQSRTTRWTPRLTSLPSGDALYLDERVGSVYVSATDQWRDVSVPWTDGSLQSVTVLRSGLVLATMANPSRAFLWSPTTEAWTPAGTPGLKVGSPSVAELADGRVMVYDSGFAYMTATEAAAIRLFDPRTRSWSTVALPQSDVLDANLAATPDGDAVLVGGAQYTRPSDCDNCYYSHDIKDTWMFDVATSQWKKQGDMAHPRGHTPLVTLPSGVLAIGGYGDYSNFPPTVASTSELFVSGRPFASIADAAIVEGPRGERALQFEVTLDRPAASELRLTVTTVNGTAKSPDDFRGGSASLVIPQGAKKASATIVVRGDSTAEPTETFKVLLSGSAARYTDAEAVGTITDDDIGTCVDLGQGPLACAGVQNPFAS